MLNTYAIRVESDFTPIAAIGALRVNEGLVGSHAVECCAFTHIFVGDTLCALGFRTGGRRKVMATRIYNGLRYVRVKEGWYTWPKVYAHVI